MIDLHSPGLLRRVLWLDAVTCAAMGILMSLAASPLAALTNLPTALLTYAGLALFPVAAFIALIGSRVAIPAAGVWIVVLGNAAWSLASLALLADQRVSPNTLGIAFVLIQAVAVALLAELEYIGLKTVGLKNSSAKATI